jgi:hypothetical protein
MYLREAEPFSCTEAEEVSTNALGDYDSTGFWLRHAIG